MFEFLSPIMSHIFGGSSLQLAAKWGAKTPLGPSMNIVGRSDTPILCTISTLGSRKPILMGSNMPEHVRYCLKMYRKRQIFKKYRYFLMAHKNFSRGRPTLGNEILSLHIWVDQICEIQLWCIFVRVQVIFYIFRLV